MIRKIALLVILSLLGLSFSAQAQTVVTNVDELRLALRAVNDGEILVRGGVYEITNWLECEIHNTTIKNYPDEQVQVILTDPNGWRVFFFGVNCHDVVLDGIDISGEKDGIKVTDGAYNITLRNLVIHDNLGHGVLITGAATHDVFVEDSLIYNNGVDNYDHGVYAEAKDIFVTGNEIFNNTGMGVHIFGGDVTGKTTVEKNYIHNNTRFGIGCYKACEIANNIVANNGGFALVGWYGVTELTAKYNTLIGKVGLGYYYNPAEINLINNVITGGYYGIQAEVSNGLAIPNIYNNLIKGNVEDIIQIRAELNLVDNVYEPFVPLDDFYAPLETNPAIGAGLSVDVNDDYYGKPRKDPPTLGALEFKPRKIKIKWNKGLKLRESASMYNNAGIGVLYKNAIIEPLFVVSNQEGIFAEISEDVWIAMHLNSNNRDYAVFMD